MPRPTTTKQTTAKRQQHRLQAALDYVEAHLYNHLSLESIAEQAHLSCYHFSRLFRSQLGCSPMFYVRSRRLAEAVCYGNSNHCTVTELALRHGFESHQGFTKAFRRVFGITPQTYLANPFVLPIQRKLTMTKSNQETQPIPEIRQRDAFTVVGLTDHFTLETKGGIPQVWDAFVPHLGNIANQLGMTTYGVCLPEPRNSGNFKYIASVQVSDVKDSPTTFVSQVIPAHTYAVFTIHGGLTDLEPTLGYIFGTWIDTCDYKLADSPDFELYDQRFDPLTGHGAIEFWVPLKA